MTSTPGAVAWDSELLTSRLDRLRSVMEQAGLDAVLTSDPVDIAYACGVRNMTVFGLMGPSRLVFVPMSGPIVLFEFAGCEHLAAGNPIVGEVRPAPGISPTSGAGYTTAIDSFAAELLVDLSDRGSGRARLAVERLDFPVTDALRQLGIELHDAGPVFQESRRIKTLPELVVVREAIRRVESCVAELRAAIAPGRREVEIWAEFHRALIATGGEFVSTRLFQSGARTFPYFQEAGDAEVQAGDLLCLDTDAIGVGGYAVDFSRTFFCPGGPPPTARQRALHRLARDQLDHNASRLAPGTTYEAFARTAWQGPAEHRPFAYYCLAHGIGLTGEAPNIPVATAVGPYPVEGVFEPGMTLCLESYVGDEATGQGVKLEDQYLVTETGAERLTTFPFDDLLDTAPPTH